MSNVPEGRNIGRNLQYTKHRVPYGTQYITKMIDANIKSLWDKKYKSALKSFCK